MLVVLVTISVTISSPEFIFVDNASYVSLFAMELEKLLVHDKISASCLIVFVFQAMYQTL